MNPDEPEATDDRFATLLAACEEALEGEEPVAPPGEPGSAPELRQRLARAKVCLKLLHEWRAERGRGPEGAAAADLRILSGEPLEHDPGSASPSPAPLALTRLGRFEIRRELGRGGGGMVFLAYDPELRRELALKVPHAEALLSSELRERFYREARAAAGLDHPGIVPVYEVGEAGPVSYIAYAYCPGLTLAAWLRQRTEPVPFRMAAALVATLADAVQHAHQNGVLHRDLKPANILLPGVRGHWESSSGIGGASEVTLTSEPVAMNPKITDFGLAKVLTAPGPPSPEGARMPAEESPTRTGTIMGTPSYMAPEQAEGKTAEIGPAADVYGLGTILYEVLTGRPPFQGEGALDILCRVQADEPVPPSRVRPNVPGDLQTICLKCLEKEPRQRYGSAYALAEDLRRFQDDRPIRARPIGRVEKAWRWSRRNPVVASLGALVALSLLIGSGISTYFAIAANERASEALLQKNRADEKSREADLALTNLCLTRGLDLGKWGEVRQGMLWLARGLQSESGANLDLDHVIRTNLGGWRRHLHGLRLLIDKPDSLESIEPDGVALSPDGKTLAVGGRNKAGQGEVHLLAAATGQPIGLPIIHGSHVDVLAFRPDGKALLMAGPTEEGRGSVVGIWAVPGGGPAGSALRPPDRITAAAFRPPDGKVVATAAGEDVQLWDVDSSQGLGPPLRHAGRVVAVTFHPDGKTLLTAAGNKAVLWDLRTREPLTKLLHWGKVLSVAFNRDGAMVLTGSSLGGQLWQVDTGKRFGPPLQHRTGVTAVGLATGKVVVAISPDGRTAATGMDDKWVRLWDTSSGNPQGDPIPQIPPVKGVVFSQDKKSIWTWGYWGIACWDAAPDRGVRAVLEHDCPVAAVAFSPDGKTLLTGGAHVPDFRASQVKWLSFLPPYRGEARLWDVPTGQPVGPPLDHPHPVLAVGFRPEDGRHFVTGCGIPLIFPTRGEARVYDTASRELVVKSLKHSLAVTDVAYSPDGKLVLTGSADLEAGRGGAWLWEAATGRPIRELPVNNDSRVICVAFAPDGRTALTGTMGDRARLWDVALGEPRGELVHPAAVHRAAFSPDGTLLLTASHNTAYLWRPETGEKLDRTFQHDSWIRGVAFSPDGRVILTGSADQTARLWDIKTGRPLAPPMVHEGWVPGAAFHPDGKLVATGSADHTARLWDIPAPVLGTPEQITLWVQVVTGQRLDPEGNVYPLYPADWNALRRRLEELGGPPHP